MSKTTRIVVLVTALISLLSIASATAGAVTWTNTGQTSFTATGGATTLSSTGTSLNCANADVVGATRTPIMGVGAAVASGTTQFTSCRMGGVTAVVHCNYTATANSWAAGVTSGNVDLFCTSFIAGRALCTTEGTLAGTYTNGASGQGTLPHSTSATVTNGPGGSCGLGGNDRITLSALTLTITSGTGPTFVTD